MPVALFITVGLFTFLFKNSVNITLETAMTSDISVTGEIFIPVGNYPCVYEGDSLRTCVERLLEKSSDDGRHLYYEWLLVIDLANVVVGSVNYIDILKTLFPFLLTPDESHVFSGKSQRFSDLSVLLEGRFEKACRRQAKMTAGGSMSAPPPSISTDTHLLHALEIMVSSGNSILTVTENQVLAGVVRMSDVFKHLGSYCTLPRADSSQSVPVL